MTAPAAHNTSRVAPMPARRRFGIATATSLAIHAAILLLIGLFSLGAGPPQEILIPIELTVSARAAAASVGGGGRPEAPAREAPTPPTSTKPEARPPSSAGARKQPAPAAPKVLTAPTGKEPSGQTAAGSAEEGAGGAEEAPAGPTHGPGSLGGPVPVYPKDALDRDLSGRVTLSVMIAADGSVKSVEVSASSGHRLLDEAAVRAVERGWAFSPGMKNGKPEPGRVVIIFVFSQGTVKEG